MRKPVFDVAIVGAGPAGATLALALAQRQLDVVVIDNRDPVATQRPDGRNFAIVTGSWHLLDSIGVAQPLRKKSQALHGLEAVDGGHHLLPPPSVLFTDRDLDSADPDETLGQMVPADALQAALDAAMDQASGLTRLAPAQFSGLVQDAGHVTLQLGDGQSLSARVIVGADGMRSTVREALGISVEGRDYGQSVFTANVSLASPHNGIARQLFTPEGPFATLPLPGDRANLAWYMKRGAAEALAARPVAEAEAELNARFAAFAGPMKIEGKAGAYPLVLQLATAMIGHRGALVGDAARRINPLAGQGLNQGFRDVAALIEVIETAVQAGLDPGSASVLERYSQSRRFDATTTSLAFDAIDRLFSNDNFLTKPVRSLGLLAASKVGPLRRFLARKASAAEDGVPGPMRGW